MNGPGYWAPEISAGAAVGHPIFAAIQHAGPWQYATHPHGGTLATWKGSSHDLAHFGEPRLVADGLHYLPPVELPSIHDLVREGPAGVDVQLACGLTISVPHATLTHRQLRLGRSSERFGDPITEYGRLACRLMDVAKARGGISYESDDLMRLIELAIGQRYRGTRELFDDMAFLAAEDVDPILGAVWCGDPKAMAPASSGEPSASPISDSTGAQ